ncbi:MAG: hypothetical protein L3J98_02945 [Gammaproteobacteria bacterium]|nr:hypothetical protein [Gammaproteobacteria bacterium]
MKNIFISRLILLVIFFVVTTNYVFAQDSKEKLSFGVESETMTWLNKGYHGSFWVGTKGLRTRFVVAKATYPDKFSPEGFENLTSEFYEIEFDYFFGEKRNEFRGLWVALGAGYTKQSIESKTTNITESIDLIAMHTGVGYAINLYKGFYINPWLGITLHLNSREVNVGSEVWKPNVIDPVLGVKIGYSFR